MELEERVATGAATEAERLAWLESLRGRGLLRPPGCIYVDCTNTSIDINQFLGIKPSNDINRFLGINRPVNKTEFLEMERLIWIAAMNYMCSEYDLLPDNMTLYPVVFEKHTWYHCNLLVRRKGHEYPSMLIFVEVKCTKGRSYDVMACSAPGKNNSNNCALCPPSMGILHPLNGTFTCGSNDGQKVFHYTIPGTPSPLVSTTTT